MSSHTRSSAMSFCHCALSSTSVWMCCCKRAHPIVISVLSFIYCLASNLKTDFITLLGVTLREVSIRVLTAIGIAFCLITLVPLPFNRQQGFPFSTEPEFRLVDPELLLGRSVF